MKNINFECYEGHIGMATAERSIRIATALSDKFREEYPDAELPSEITPNPILTDSEKNIYFVAIREPCGAVTNDTDTVSFDTFDNDRTWDNFTQLPEGIKTLYLGHDGVIYEGENGAIKRALQHLTNLTKIHICGYYCQYEDALEDAIRESGREIDVVRIY